MFLAGFCPFCIQTSCFRGEVQAGTSDSHSVEKAPAVETVEVAESDEKNVGGASDDVLEHGTAADGKAEPEGNDLPAVSTSQTGVVGVAGMVDSNQEREGSGGDWTTPSVLVLCRDHRFGSFFF